jgi:hypothetical protein
MKNIIRPIVWKNSEFGFTEQGNYYNIYGNSSEGYGAKFVLRGVETKEITACQHNTGGAILFYGDKEVVRGMCEEHHKNEMMNVLKDILTIEAFEHLKSFDDSKNKFYNNNLNFDLEKISSYDEVDIEMDYDKNLVDKYIIRVNDNSYFYRERVDRNSDFDKLRKMFVGKMS